MYYVIEIELRSIGTLKILNEGKPFENLETAQMYCNEIYSENASDMSDYIELKILQKREVINRDIYDVLLRLL